MSDLDEIYYWHTFIDGGTGGCAAILAGGMRCHARRNQHDETEAEDNEEGNDE